MGPIGLVIHGGCGLIDRAQLEGSEKEAVCRRVLAKALAVTSS